MLHLFIENNSGRKNLFPKTFDFSFKRKIKKIEKEGLYRWQMILLNRRRRNHNSTKLWQMLQLLGFRLQFLSALISGNKFCNSRGDIINGNGLSMRFPAQTDDIFAGPQLWKRLKRFRKNKQILRN
jgi:hypothetical protein